MAETKNKNEVEDEDFEILLWDHSNDDQKSGFTIWKKQLMIMLNKNITLQV